MNALVKIIAPIVVLLASLGSLFFVSELAKNKEKQRGEISSLNGSLQRTEQKLANTEKVVRERDAALLASANRVAQVEADLTSAKKEAADAQNLAQQRMKDIETAQAQTAEKAKEVEETKAKLATAEQEMAKLQETAAKVGELAKLDDLKKQVAALTDENKELGRQLTEMRGKNVSLAKDLEERTTTPVNVRGQVAAVQDRWGFVVLNIGEAHKVRPEAQFGVYRDNKLICKVQVVSIGQNTSIAEILPDLQRGAPRIGDKVLR
jgi:predicted  nucleic acid-binding Zn-ribbon protein